MNTGLTEWGGIILVGKTAIQHKLHAGIVHRQSRPEAGDSRSVTIATKKSSSTHVIAIHTHTLVAWKRGKTVQQSKQVTRRQPACTSTFFTHKKQAAMYHYLYHPVPHDTAAHLRVANHYNRAFFWK